MPETIKPNNPVTPAYEIVGHWYCRRQKEWQYVVQDTSYDMYGNDGFGINVTESCLRKNCWKEGNVVYMKDGSGGLKDVDRLRLEITDVIVEDGNVRYRGTFDTWA